MPIVGQTALSIGHLPAAADLSAHQFKLVKITPTGVAVCDGVGDQAIGVLQNKPLAGQPCTITVIGVTELIAGSAAIIAGDQVFLTATGTVDETATSTKVGVALEAASNGKLFTALVNLGGTRV